jgi:hypothetical protein
LKRGGRSYWERSPAAFSVQAWRRFRPDEGALPVSEKKEGDRVPVREWLLGCGLDSLLGRNLSPGSNSIFILFSFFSLFCFPFSFILISVLSFEEFLLFRFEWNQSWPIMVL